MTMHLEMGSRHYVTLRGGQSLMFSDTWLTSEDESLNVFAKIYGSNSCCTGSKSCDFIIDCQLILQDEDEDEGIHLAEGSSEDDEMYRVVGVHYFCYSTGSALLNMRNRTGSYRGLRQYLSDHHALECNSIEYMSYPSKFEGNERWFSSHDTSVFLFVLFFYLFVMALLILVGGHAY